MRIKIIGAGLAGCEAAYQAALAGCEVELVEMKGQKMSLAHTSENFAELVCSNSLKSNDILTGGGLLKEELRRLGSLLIACADQTAVAAGGALAVDRERFSALVTEKIRTLPNIKITEKIENCIEPEEGETVIVATGPLTDSALLLALEKVCGTFLYFYDAAAPIVTQESIDMNGAFYAGRYNKGGEDYINCPLTKDEYLQFYAELIAAETATLKSFEYNVFERCMPIEAMAKRGVDTMRFGPMRPVGLRDPRNGERPYAVIQLRRENALGSLFNIVGFQTNLTFKAQKRVFSLIPALKNAEFVRYGVMHRNTFINSPQLLNTHFQLKANPNIFFAGQISGVEGYVESIASGLVCGINAALSAARKTLTEFENNTMIGALAAHISTPSSNFQPMGANFGILSPIENPPRNKDEKKQQMVARALEGIDSVVKALGRTPQSII